MFTVEMDTEAGQGTTITSLDESNQYDDIEVILFDDVVFLRQFDKADGVQLLSLTNNQLRDIISAIDLPTGTYRSNLK
jgi:hypothetical protein